MAESSHFRFVAQPGNDPKALLNFFSILTTQKSQPSPPKKFKKTNILSTHFGASNLHRASLSVIARENVSIGG